MGLPITCTTYKLEPISETTLSLFQSLQAFHADIVNIPVLHYTALHCIVVVGRGWNKTGTRGELGSKVRM
jgi:hypothetical protein